MAKKLSNIGNIMDLLDISLSELSLHLHVDKTTISKWRTGGRRLTARSPYLDPILLFFMGRVQGDGRLELFLAEHFPELGSQGGPDVIACLRRYLTAVPEPEHSVPEPFYASDLSVAPEHYLFVGVEGRKQAVDRMLTIAEHLPGPATIKILELEQMNWLCRDMGYLRHMMLRLKQLALRKFCIEFAFSTTLNSPSFRAFIIMLDDIRYDKNIKNYIVDTDRISGLLPRIYAIDGIYAAVGLDSEESHIPIHTNSFADQLNAHKYARLFDRVIQLYGSEALITDKGIELDRVLDTVSHMATKKEDLFFYGDYLSVTTMSAPLLHEILNDNGIIGGARERCLRYYRYLRQAIECTSPSYSGFYYHSLNALESALSYDYVIDYELSAMAGRQIRKTLHQYRRHLSDTVEFLRGQEHTRILLFSGGYQRLRSCSWVKKKLWCLCINTLCVPNEHQVIFLDDLNLVNVATELCDQSVKDAPVEHRAKSYSLSLLERLSRGEKI